MVSASMLPPGEVVATADQRVVMHNVPWSHYEVQLALRGEAPVPRMAYLRGVLELITPSKGHERTAASLATLVKAYAFERGILLSSYRSWTLKAAPDEVGAEPDECFLFGPDQERDRPDLAIEVIWTSGSIDKLAIYRRLRVPEVWFWQDRQLTVHLLEGLAYRQVERSSFLPALDLVALCSFLDRRTETEAERDFRAYLRRTE